MFKYFIKRLLLLIPVVIGVSILVFLIMHVFSTDPTSIILGQHASQEQIDALRQQLGLNDPLYVQYFKFIGGIITGDFGTSLITKSSVATEIFSRFPATIELAILSIIVASIVGINTWSYFSCKAKFDFRLSLYGDIFSWGIYAYILAWITIDSFIFSSIGMVSCIR